MRAIILAAGLGSRLGTKSKSIPKALLRVGDRTLIEHQLEALSSEGVGPVLVVIGHEADKVRALLGESVEYVVNERPSETNSLYSLWLARDFLAGDVLLLNSDLLFDPAILKDLLACQGSALAYDSVTTTGAEQTKVGLQGARVTDLGKDLPATGARGENLGLIKLDTAGSVALRRRTEAIVAAGEQKAWVTEAVRSILAEVEVRAVNVAGKPWVEIDFPYDLDRARRNVWPQIQKQQDPVHVVRRRARWAAIAALPLLMSAAAWSLAARVGPASVDWETLVPAKGEPVRLTKAGENGTQKWWVLRPGEHLTVEADGGKPVRVEARPLLQHARDTASFAIAVRLNAQPFRFAAKRAGLDPRLTLRGTIIGERDRETYELPAGTRELSVDHLGGTSAAVLVRIRQPE